MACLKTLFILRAGDVSAHPLHACLVPYEIILRVSCLNDNVGTMNVFNGLSRKYMC